MKLKAALIGCGWLGEVKHLRCLKMIPEVDVVAFYDEKRENAQRLMQLYGSGTVYTDCFLMLETEKPDVVHISAPAVERVKLTEMALKAGCHILLDKPMCISDEGVEAIRNACSQSDRILTMSIQSKFCPDLSYLKKQADADFFGDIYHVDINFATRRSVPVVDEPMKATSGGGPMYDMGSHALDAALWIMNNYEPLYVCGKTYQKLNRQGRCNNLPKPWDPKIFDVEDSAFAFIVMKNGATIHMTTAWAMNVPEDYGQISVYGVKAGAQTRSRFGHYYQSDSIMKGLHITKAEEDCMVDTDINFYPGGVDIPNYFVDMEYYEQRHFYDSILGKCDPIIPIENSFVVQRILNAVYESDKTGKPVCF